MVVGGGASAGAIGMLLLWLLLLLLLGWWLLLSFVTVVVAVVVVGAGRKSIVVVMCLYGAIFQSEWDGNGMRWDGMELVRWCRFGSSMLHFEPSMHNFCSHSSCP